MIRKYLGQAQKLNDFINSLDYKDYNSAELKEFLKIIINSYVELLVGISFYAPIIAPYTTKNMPEIASKFSEPPFEKEFFNSHHL